MAAMRKTDNGMECVVERSNEKGLVIERLYIKQSGQRARETIDAQIMNMAWDEQAEWELRR